jgi:hypothetical protein
VSDTAYSTIVSKESLRVVCLYVNDTHSDALLSSICLYDVLIVQVYVQQLPLVGM